MPRRTKMIATPATTSIRPNRSAEDCGDERGLRSMRPSASSSARLGDTPEREGHRNERRDVHAAESSATTPTRPRADDAPRCGRPASSSGRAVMTDLLLRQQRRRTRHKPRRTPHHCACRDGRPLSQRPRTAMRLVLARPRSPQRPVPRRARQDASRPSRFPADAEAPSRDESVRANTRRSDRCRLAIWTHIERQNHAAVRFSRLIR